MELSATALNPVLSDEVVEMATVDLGASEGSVSTAVVRSRSLQWLYRTSLSRAEAWLKTQPLAQTTQAAVLRLLMKLQATAPPEELRATVDGLNALQCSGGGWSQLPDRPSDAYATGQVLYALSLAEVAPDSEPIRKAVEFLISTQREDGSWPMTRRTQTGEPASQNMIPITYFGSAWATLGLMRSLSATKVTTP